MREKPKGKHVSKETKEPIYIRLDPEVIREIDQIAKDQSRSRSNMVRVLIMAGLAEQITTKTKVR